MRNLKKVLGLVLCLAMMLSIMVVGAGAAFADQSDIDTKHTEAVDMCNALNIITGFENGKFMPKDNVTREQMAKMICVLDNGGKEPQLATGSTFTDVPADRWSNKYIESCAARGIVVGVGGGKFAPAGKVTATQAAKMLLVELGYDDDLQKYTGSNWATNVNIDATKKGYYEDLEDIDVNAPLTREHAAQMIWNALQAVEVDYNYTLVTNPDGSISSKVTEGDKVVTDKDGKTSAVTLLADKYKGEVEEGILNGFKYDSNKQEWTYYVDGDTDIPAVKSSQDFTALLGQKVKVSYDNSGSAATKDAYGIFVTDSEIALEGQFGDLPDLKKASDTSFKVDGTTYKLDKTVGETPVFQFCGVFGTPLVKAVTKTTTVDGRETTTVVSPAVWNLYQVAGGDITKYDAQNFTAVDQDGNGKINFFMVTPFTIAKVTYANNDKFRVAQPIGEDFYATMPNNKEITKEDVTVYDGIAKDDYVAIIDETNTADGTTVFTKADQVSGKVTVKDGDDVTIDGNVYTLDAAYAKAGDVKAGTTMTDAVVYNGYVFDATLSSNFDVTDYVVAVAKNDSGYDATVKLLFSDGSKKVVTLSDESPVKYDKINAGTLYTYEKNKDDEYKLTVATTVNTGFDYANGVTPYGTGTVTVNKTSNSSAKVGYIDSNYKVADDAVIFIKYNEKTTGSGSGASATTTASYKVITGTNLKTMSTKTNGFTGYYVVADDNSSTGVGEVAMAYLKTDASSVKTDDSQYAYITKCVSSTNEDGDEVFLVTLLTKDGVQDPIETVKKSDIDGKKDMLKAGNAIEYTLDTDGKLDEVVQATATMVPITAKYDDALGIDGTKYELDDNIAYLLIDADEKEPVGEGVGTMSDLQVAEKPDSAGNVANAYVLYNSDKEIALVAYDVNQGGDADSVWTVTVKGGDIFKPKYPATVSAKEGTPFTLVLPESQTALATTTGYYKVTVTGATISSAVSANGRGLWADSDAYWVSTGNPNPTSGNPSFAKKTFTIGNITGPVTVTFAGPEANRPT